MTSIWLSPELKAIRAGRSPRALASVELASLWSDAPVCHYLLRRSGGRPVRFDGILLVEHLPDGSDGHEGQRAHTARIYETTDQRIVVELVLSARDGSGIPHAKVEEVASLRDAQLFLELYDPSAQATFSLPLDIDVDGAEMDRHVSALRADVEHLRSDYDITRKAVFAAATEMTPT
jgi:hypothetical protein